MGKLHDFSIRSPSHTFFLLFREGGLGFKSPRPPISYYRIHYSYALRYAYLCAIIDQDSAYILWLDMLLIRGWTVPSLGGVITRRRMEPHLRRARLNTRHLVSLTLPFSIQPFRLERTLLVHAVLRGCHLHLAVNYLEYVVFPWAVALAGFTVTFTQLLHTMSLPDLFSTVIPWNGVHAGGREVWQ
jgi:hypothetical protein